MVSLTVLYMYMYNVGGGEMVPVVNHNYAANELISRHEIHLRRQGSGFGLIISGGKEDGSQVWNKLHVYTCTCTCKEPGKYIQARTSKHLVGLWILIVMSCTVSILLLVIYKCT